MTTQRSIVYACLVVAFCCVGATSDERPVNKNAEPVARVLASLAAGYNARDAKAISELFTTTGEFIAGAGNVFQGRDAISREFAALFEINPQNAIVITADDVRELSPGVVAADCVVRVAAAEKAADPAAVHVEFAALLVRQSDGKWQFASIRSHGEPDLQSPHAHLQRLAWLVGEWVDESSESTLHSNTRWSEDGNFLLTDFSVHVAGRKAVSGTQRIGWDASLEQFRSWVFESDGAFAVGVWTELDDRFVVKVTGARSDGLTGSATHTYQMKSPHAYFFAATDRIVGDESLPEFVSHVIRKPPEPAQSTAASPSGR